MYVSFGWSTYKYVLGQHAKETNETFTDKELEIMKVVWDWAKGSQRYSKPIARARIITAFLTIIRVLEQKVISLIVKKGATIFIVRRRSKLTRANS